MDGHQDTMDPQLDTNPTTKPTKVPTKDTGKEWKRTPARSTPTRRARTRRTHRTTNHWYVTVTYHHMIGMLPKPSQAQEGMEFHHKNLGAFPTTVPDKGNTTRHTKSVRRTAAKDPPMNHYL